MKSRDASVQSTTSSRPWSGSFDFFAKAPPNPRLPASASSAAARRRRRRSSDLEDPAQPGYSFDSAVSFSESVPEEGDSGDESTDGDESATSDSSSSRSGRGRRSPLSALPRPNRVLDVRADILTRVSIDGLSLMHASEELRNDKEVVLAAVEQDGAALEFASDALRGDREVVLAAVLSDEDALGEASKELQGDKDVVLAAVTLNGLALEYASARLLKSKHGTEVVMAAVLQNGLALEHASAKQQADKKLVLLAVAQNGRALDYAAPALKNDKEVVMAAVAQNGIALVEASEELQSDKEVAVRAVAQNGLSLQHAKGKALTDKKVVKTACKQNGAALKYASKKSRNDRKVVLIAVDRVGEALGDASEELRGDKEVVMAAVQRDGAALRFASSALRGDKEVVLAAVQSKGRTALRKASKSLQDDVELVQAAVSFERMSHGGGDFGAAARLWASSSLSSSSDSSGLSSMDSTPAAAAAVRKKMGNTNERGNTKSGNNNSFNNATNSFDTGSGANYRLRLTPPRPTRGIATPLRSKSTLPSTASKQPSFNTSNDTSHTHANTNNTNNKRDASNTSSRQSPPNKLRPKTPMSTTTKTSTGAAGAASRSGMATPGRANTVSRGRDVSRGANNSSNLRGRVRSLDDTTTSKPARKDNSQPPAGSEPSQPPLPPSIVRVRRSSDSGPKLRASFSFPLETPRRSDEDINKAANSSGGGGGSGRAAAAEIAPSLRAKQPLTSMVPQHVECSACCQFFVPEKKASTPKAKKAAMKVVKARQKKKGAMKPGAAAPASNTAAPVTPAKDTLSVSDEKEEEKWFLCPVCIRDLSEAETEMAAAQASFSARLATPVRGWSWNESALRGAASGQRVVRRINARLDRVADGNEDDDDDDYFSDDDDDSFGDDQDLSDFEGYRGDVAISASGSTRVRRRRRGSLGMDDAKMQLVSPSGDDGSSSRSSGGHNSSGSRSRAGGDGSVDGHPTPDKYLDAGASNATKIGHEPEGSAAGKAAMAARKKYSACPVCGCRVSVEVTSSLELDENTPCEACAAGLLDAEQEAEASWIAQVSRDSGDGFPQAPVSACNSPILLSGSVKVQTSVEVEHYGFGGTANALMPPPPTSAPFTLDPSSALQEPTFPTPSAATVALMSKEAKDSPARRRGAASSDPLATAVNAPPPSGPSGIALQQPPLLPLPPQGEEAAAVENRSGSFNGDSGSTGDGTSSTSDSKSRTFFAMKSSRPPVSAAGALPKGVVAGSGSAIR